MDELLDRAVIADERHEHRIGSGLAERVAAPHRFCQALLASELWGFEGVGARIQHERNARRIGGGPGGADAFDRERKVDQALSFHSIFQIHSNGSGIDDTTHSLRDGLGRHAVACLHVGGNGHIDAARDACDGGQHLVSTDPLAVRVSQAEGDPRTRRGECLEARFDEDPRAARVPRVGQHEHRALDVESSQDLGFSTKL